MIERLKLMPRIYKQLILLLLDLFSVVCAFFTAATLQMHDWPGAAFFVGTSPVLALSILFAAVISWALRIPHIQLKSFDFSASTRSAALSFVLGGVIYGLSGIFGTGLNGIGAIIFALAFAVLSIAMRVVLLQLLLRLYRSTTRNDRVLIYGAGRTGLQLALALKHHDSIVPLGFVDDNVTLQRITVAGMRVYSPLRLPELIKKLGVNRVLLAMPSLRAPQQAQLARQISKMGVDVQALPSFAQMIGSEAMVGQLRAVLPNTLLRRRQRLDDGMLSACEAYRDKCVLISGAGGSIGAELCRQILNCRPRRLVLLELSEYGLFSIDSELRALAEDVNCEIIPVLGTVTERRQVRAALADHDVQIVLHAAAYKHVSMVEANVLSALANNVLGTHVMAEEAMASNVERFILVSTDKAVEPKGVMGATKRMAELIVGDMARRASPTVFCSVRFGNVIGSSGSVIPLFRDQIACGGPVTVTDAEATRYFMTAQEAARLVLQAGKLARGAEIFVLDMGDPVRIRELAEQLITASGYRLRNAENPNGDIEIRFTGLKSGEKLHERLSFAQHMSETDHPKIFTTQEATLSTFHTARAVQAIRKVLAMGDSDAARSELMFWIARDLENLRTAFGHGEPAGATLSVRVQS